MNARDRLVQDGRADPLASLRHRLDEALGTGTRPLDVDVGLIGRNGREKAVPCRSPRLVVRVNGHGVTLAFFAAPARPGHACPHCLDRRLLSTLTVEEQWAIARGHVRQGQGAALLAQPLADNVVNLARQLVASGVPAGCQRVVTFDLRTQEQRVDELLADAYCDGCPPPAVPDEGSAVLPLRASLPARSGRSRMRGLLEHRLPHRALVNPICGAVGQDLLEGNARSVTAPVFSSYVQHAEGARPRVVAWSGLCLRNDESRNAGVLEALERQAGMWAPQRAVAATSSYRGVASQAMDPATCFRYNDESYELPLGLARYDADLPIEWVWGYGLMSGQARLVPRQLASYARLSPQSGPKLADNNSSGCALGSCYEEAILKALLELIERDSFVIAWHRMISLPRIDARRCRDPGIAMVLARLAHAEIEVSLLDGRLDLRVPSVIAVARRRDGSMTVGAAACTDPVDAMRSAVMECATSIVEMPYLLKESAARLEELMADHSRVATVMDHQLLYAAPEMAQRLSWLDGSERQLGDDEAYGPELPPGSRDIGQDLADVLAQLRACGMDEAYVVDLTTPEQRQLDLKTVRVIVPGLAPIDFGHPRNRAQHLERMWTAPRRAGLEGRVAPGENRLPHPFP